jgi:hypothetical protein
MGKKILKKTSIAVALVVVAVLAGGVSGSAPTAPGTAQAAPRSFFGIVPQAVIDQEDAEYMRAARIGSIRLPIGWESIQSSPRGPWDWGGTDREIATAVNQGLNVLPFLAGVPHWASHRGTRLPTYNARVRRGWMRFVRGVVERYGPGGRFWREHPPGVMAKDGIRLNRWKPIHAWQIWNEANFFYFAFPVSPANYARLLKISYRAVKAADPRAQVILSGLFGEPDQGGRYGMDADVYLERLYRVPGIRRFFDGVALHPYAFHVRDLERMVEEMRDVVVRNHDARKGLYITEMGWGSKYNPNVVAFDQGWHGQARELRGAYRFLLRNRRRLNLRAAYWFTCLVRPGQHHRRAPAPVAARRHRRPRSK